MNLPDLPPDIVFHAMTDQDDAFEESFEVKRAALGPVIVERWGWDEPFQRKVHRARYAAKPFLQILREHRKVGTISFEQMEDCFRLGEFYLFPSQQKQGLGTRILRHCISVADEVNLPIRLEYLKWNPVGSLYKRNGFVIVGETEIHWHMQRVSSRPRGL